MPATAPHGANVSVLLRSRSCTCRRGKYMSASGLWNGQRHMPASASAGVVQPAGGSTTSSACSRRHSRAATSSVLMPTSCSRVSGGMHSRLK
ncbi:hypothetical protein EON77_01520 [bacterium]|nr:MAG: hypothetical protein EON77_01520 [bacterium]